MSQKKTKEQDPFDDLLSDITVGYDEGSDMSSVMAEMSGSIPSGKKKQAAKTEVAHRIFELSGSNTYGGSVSISCNEVVVDPDTGNQRAARVLNGVTTIWVDEQLTAEKTTTKYRPEYVTFNKGRAIIPTHQKTILKFLELSNRNQDNQNRFGHNKVEFKEWNPSIQAKKDMADEYRLIEAMQSAMTAKDEVMIPHARFLGIEFEQEGIPLEPSAIRAKYVLSAKRNPKAFLDTFGSPLVSLTYLVDKRVRQGAIDLSREKGAAWWTGGGFICVIDPSEDVTPQLVKFAMGESEESLSFLKMLKSLSAKLL